MTATNNESTNGYGNGNDNGNENGNGDIESSDMEVEMTALTNTQTNAKTKTKLERSGNDRGGDGASVTSTSSSASLSLDDLLPPSKLYAGKCNDNDLDELLGIDMDEFQLREEQKQKQKLKKKQQQKQRRWCCTNTNTNTNTCGIRKSISCTRLGSTIILSQYCYDKFQWCIIGPQYIGLLFTLTLLHSATYFFTKQAYIHIGTISAAFCILFHILSTACLLCVSCRDPGIVRPRHYRNIHNKNNNNKKKKRRNDQEYEGLMTNDDDDENDTNGNDDDNNNMADDMDMPLEEGWRFCALCNIHQPPKAVHCPECHVCVDGYDHHCPWMGCCVGKGNMKAFMLFNLSWLMYFLYAAIWVAFLGPMIFKKHRDQEF